jgi:carboxypeptidase D
MFNTDVATGKVPASGSHNNYSASGSSSSWHMKNKLPEIPPINCNLWVVPSTCTVDQLKALANGTAEIDEGFRVVKPAGGGGPIHYISGF